MPSQEGLVSLNWHSFTGCGDLWTPCYGNGTAVEAADQVR